MRSQNQLHEPQTSGVNGVIERTLPESTNQHHFTTGYKSHELTRTKAPQHIGKMSAQAWFPVDSSVPLRALDPKVGVSF